MFASRGVFSSRGGIRGLEGSFCRRALLLRGRGPRSGRSGLQPGALPASSRVGIVASGLAGPAPGSCPRPFGARPGGPSIRSAGPTPRGVRLVPADRIPRTAGRERQPRVAGAPPSPVRLLPSSRHRVLGAGPGAPPPKDAGRGQDEGRAALLAAHDPQGRCRQDHRRHQASIGQLPPIAHLAQRTEVGASRFGHEGRRDGRPPPHAESATQPKTCAATTDPRDGERALPDRQAPRLPGRRRSTAPTSAASLSMWPLGVGEWIRRVALHEAAASGPMAKVRARGGGEVARRRR